MCNIKMDTNLWEDARRFWPGSPSYPGNMAWQDLQRDREEDLRNGLPPREGEDAFPYFQGIPGAGIIMAASLIQRRLRMIVRRLARVVQESTMAALMRGVQEGGVHNRNDLLRWLPHSQRKRR